MKSWHLYKNAMLMDAKKMGKIKTEEEVEELRGLMKNGNSYVPNCLKKKEVDQEIINNMLMGNLNRSIYAAQIDEHVWKPEPKTVQQSLMRKFIKSKMLDINTLKIRK